MILSNQVTKLVKEGTRKTTLTIGDGANDVGIIQEANIVIGISRCEGMQIPRDEEGEPLYEDFIYQGCAAICSFLTYYLETISASIRINVANLTKEKAVLEDLPSSMKL
ncbi:unnamed protein product [Fraxinus pennsylvanica]|uniref:Uncharacterized protein n=1 Tax=Fraxinus pennsylvanica TaxID=56036 RepID=A0AAD1ZGW0_9LAMI|nr:unnamed protein product [Fraxinus pennsylvanica]CAI9769563.1 unnamed protein product [Fraxinus pennsylvanica]